MIQCAVKYTVENDDCARQGIIRRRSVQVVLQAAAAAGVTELAQRLRLDLADAFARDAELLADLFEGAAAAIVEAETQTPHFLFALSQAAQRVFHLLFQQLVAGGLGGSERGVVLPPQSGSGTSYSVAMRASKPRPAAAAP